MEHVSLVHVGLFHLLDIASSHHRPEIVEPALNDSLEEAGLDYFDVRRLLSRSFPRPSLTSSSCSYTSCISLVL
jgi:diketogulonate reductase-like aldo/keto reductase